MKIGIKLGYTRFEIK